MVKFRFIVIIILLSGCSTFPKPFLDGGGAGGGGAYVPDYGKGVVVHESYLKRLQFSYFFPEYTYAKDGSLSYREKRYGLYGYLVFNDNTDATVQRRKSIAKAFRDLMETENNGVAYFVPQESIVNLQVPIKSGHINDDLYQSRGEFDLSAYQRAFLASHDYQFSRDLLKYIGKPKMKIAIIFSPYQLTPRFNKRGVYLENELIIIDLSVSHECQVDEILKHILPAFTTNAKVVIKQVPVAEINSQIIYMYGAVPDIPEYSEDDYSGNILFGLAGSFAKLVKTILGQSISCSVNS